MILEFNNIFLKLVTAINSKDLFKKQMNNPAFLAGFFISGVGFIKVRRTQPQMVNKLAISNCYYYPDIAPTNLGLQGA